MNSASVLPNCPFILIKRRRCAAPGPALPAPGSGLGRPRPARPRRPSRALPLILPANSSCILVRWASTRAAHDRGPIRLAVRAGALADSGAHPIVSATRVKGSEKLRERAIPAIARSVGRGRGDHLMRPRVLAANQHQGRMRASSGQDLVSPVLLRSDMPATGLDGADPRSLRLSTWRTGP
jgi:hypothetical protein